MRELDPYWGTNPTDVRCTVAECVDILLRVSDYFETKEPRFSPQLLLEKSTLTWARFNIIGCRDAPKAIGSIEISKTGTGCRVQLSLWEGDEGAAYRSVHQVVSNVFHYYDLVTAPGVVVTAATIVEAAQKADVEVAAAQLAQPADSGHFSRSASGRRQLVEEFRRDRKLGRVYSKRAWAAQHNISVKTLLRWEREFPEEERDM